MSKYMTMREAARELGMSVSGLYKVMDRDPKFPTFKLGGRRLVRREALDEYVRESEQRDAHERGLA